VGHARCRLCGSGIRGFPVLLRLRCRPHVSGAVERHLEIIGEAANRVSRSFREAHPEIPWQRIVAQRNVLAHEYGEIENTLVWRVATIRIPELIQQLQRLLPPLPPQPNGGGLL